MKFVLRYGLATLLIVIAVILIVPPFAASLIERWSRSDVESRSVLAFNSALDDFTTLLEEHNAKKIVALFDRMALDEQLLAVGFCDQTGALLYKTKAMPPSFTCKQATLRKTPPFRHCASAVLAFWRRAFQSPPRASTGILCWCMTWPWWSSAAPRPDCGRSSFLSTSSFSPPPLQFW